MVVLAWLWFVIVQVIQLLATAVGWLLLIAPCALQLWHVDAKSIKDGRPISTWSVPLGYVYGNPEDGVSGQEAKLIGGGPYLPDAGPRWRAYSWSALRNSCDNLKYVFAWENGPFYQGTVFGLPVKLGWQRENGIKVPVISVR